MPLTVDNSPELLNEEIDMSRQRTQRVRVLRPFYHRNEIVGIGAVLDLKAGVAAELQHARKVEFVDPNAKIKSSDEVPPPPGAEGDDKAAKSASAKAS